MLLLGVQPHLPPDGGETFRAPDLEQDVGLVTSMADAHPTADGSLANGRSVTSAAASKMWLFFCRIRAPRLYDRCA